MQICNSILLHFSIFKDAISNRKKLTAIKYLPFLHLRVRFILHVPALSIKSSGISLKLCHGAIFDDVDRWATTTDVFFLLESSFWRFL